MHSMEMKKKNMRNHHLRNQTTRSHPPQTKMEIITKIMKMRQKMMPTNCLLQDLLLFLSKVSQKQRTALSLLSKRIQIISDLEIETLLYLENRSQRAL